MRLYKVMRYELPDFTCEEVQITVKVEIPYGAKINEKVLKKVDHLFGNIKFDLLNLKVPDITYSSLGPPWITWD